MLIILEGVDGAGKTTIAEGIVEGTRGARLEHFGQPKQHPISEYCLTVERYVPGSGDTLVCDRFHLGEMIYSHIYRDGSELGDAGMWYVEQLIRSRGGVTCHVTAPLPTIIDRLQTRGEDYLRPEHVELVHTRFSELAAGIPDALTITSPTENELINQLLLTAAVREGRAHRLTPFPSYVGPVKPALLLVGETPNVSDRWPLHQAAFPPYPGTSGKYLIENVVLHADNPTMIGMVNAYHHGLTPIDVKELWQVLEEPRVVSLGAKADHHLSVLGLPHTKVPHPQWVRRFHHHEPEPYRDAILAGL